MTIDGMPVRWWNLFNIFDPGWGHDFKSNRLTCCRCGISFWERGSQGYSCDQIIEMNGKGSRVAVWNLATGKLSYYFRGQGGVLHRSPPDVQPDAIVEQK